MSATIFLLILAVVVIVFVAYVIKSWNALGSVARTRRKAGKNKAGKNDGNGPL